MDIDPPNTTLQWELDGLPVQAQISTKKEARQQGLDLIQRYGSDPKQFDKTLVLQGELMGQPVRLESSIGDLYATYAIVFGKTMAAKDAPFDRTSTGKVNHVRMLTQTTVLAQASRLYETDRPISVHIAGTGAFDRDVLWERIIPSVRDYVYGHEYLRKLFLYAFLFGVPGNNAWFFVVYENGVSETRVLSAGGFVIGEADGAMLLFPEWTTLIPASARSSAQSTDDPPVLPFIQGTGGGFPYSTRNTWLTTIARRFLLASTLVPTQQTATSIRIAQGFLPVHRRSEKPTTPLATISEDVAGLRDPEDAIPPPFPPLLPHYDPNLEWGPTRTTHSRVLAFLRASDENVAAWFAETYSERYEKMSEKGRENMHAEMHKNRHAVLASILEFVAQHNSVDNATDEWQIVDVLMQYFPNVGTVADVLEFLPPTNSRTSPQWILPFYANNPSQLLPWAEGGPDAIARIMGHHVYRLQAVTDPEDYAKFYTDLAKLIMGLFLAKARGIALGNVPASVFQAVADAIYGRVPEDTRKMMRDQLTEPIGDREPIYPGLGERAPPAQSVVAPFEASEISLADQTSPSTERSTTPRKPKRKDDAEPGESKEKKKRKSVRRDRVSKFDKAQIDFIEEDLDTFWTLHCQTQFEVVRVTNSDDLQQTDEMLDLDPWAYTEPVEPAGTKLKSLGKTPEAKKEIREQAKARKEEYEKNKAAFTPDDSGNSAAIDELNDRASRYVAFHDKGSNPDNIRTHSKARREGGLDIPFAIERYDEGSDTMIGLNKMQALIDKLHQDPGTLETPEWFVYYPDIVIAGKRGNSLRPAGEAADVWVIAERAADGKLRPIDQTEYQIATDTTEILEAFRKALITKSAQSKRVYFTHAAYLSPAVRLLLLAVRNGMWEIVEALIKRYREDKDCFKNQSQARAVFAFFAGDQSDYEEILPESLDDMLVFLGLRGRLYRTTRGNQTIKLNEATSLRSSTDDGNPEALPDFLWDAIENARALAGLTLILAIRTSDYDLFKTAAKKSATEMGGTKSSNFGERFFADVEQIMPPQARQELVLSDEPNDFQRAVMVNPFDYALRVYFVFHHRMVMPGIYRTLDANGDKIAEMRRKESFTILRKMEEWMRAAGEDYLAMQMENLSPDFLDAANLLLAPESVVNIPDVYLKARKDEIGATLASRLATDLSALTPNELAVNIQGVGQEEEKAYKQSNLVRKIYRQLKDNPLSVIYEYDLRKLLAWNTQRKKQITSFYTEVLDQHRSVVSRKSPIVITGTSRYAYPRWTAVTHVVVARNANTQYSAMLDVHLFARGPNVQASVLSSTLRNLGGPVGGAQVSPSLHTELPNYLRSEAAKITRSLQYLLPTDTPGLVSGPIDSDERLIMTFNLNLREHGQAPSSIFRYLRPKRRFIHAYDNASFFAKQHIARQHRRVNAMLALPLGSVLWRFRWRMLLFFIPEDQTPFSLDEMGISSLDLSNAVVMLNRWMYDESGNEISQEHHRDLMATFWPLISNSGDESLLTDFEKEGNAELPFWQLLSLAANTVFTPEDYDRLDEAHAQLLELYAIDLDHKDAAKYPPLSDQDRRVLDRRYRDLNPTLDEIEENLHRALLGPDVQDPDKFVNLDPDESDTPATCSPKSSATNAEILEFKALRALYRDESSQVEKARRALDEDEGPIRQRVPEIITIELDPDDDDDESEDQSFDPERSSLEDEETGEGDEAEEESDAMDVDEKSTDDLIDDREIELLLEAADDLGIKQTSEDDEAAMEVNEAEAEANTNTDWERIKRVITEPEPEMSDLRAMKYDVGEDAAPGMTEIWEARVDRKAPWQRPAAKGEQRQTPSDLRDRWPAFSNLAFSCLDMLEFKGTALALLARRQMGLPRQPDNAEISFHFPDDTVYIEELTPQQPVDSTDRVFLQPSYSGYFADLKPIGKQFQKDVLLPILSLGADLPLVTAIGNDILAFGIHYMYTFSDAPEGDDTDPSEASFRAIYAQLLYMPSDPETRNILLSNWFHEHTEQQERYAEPTDPTDRSAVTIPKSDFPTIENVLNMVFEDTLKDQDIRPDLVQRWYAVATKYFKDIGTQSPTRAFIQNGIAKIILGLSLAITRIDEKLHNTSEDAEEVPDWVETEANTALNLLVRFLKLLDSSTHSGDSLLWVTPSDTGKKQDIIDFGIRGGKTRPKPMTKPAPATPPSPSPAPTPSQPGNRPPWMATVPVTPWVTPSLPGPSRPSPSPAPTPSQPGNVPQPRIPETQAQTFEWPPKPRTNQPTAAPTKSPKGPEESLFDLPEGGLMDKEDEEALFSTPPSLADPMEIDVQSNPTRQEGSAKSVSVTTSEPPSLQDDGDAMEMLQKLTYEPILRQREQGEISDARYAWAIRNNDKAQNLLFMAADDQYFPLMPTNATDSAEERNVFNRLFEAFGADPQGAPAGYFNAMLVSYLPDRSVNDIRANWEQSWLRRYGPTPTAHIRHVIFGAPVDVDISNDGPVFKNYSNPWMLDVTITGQDANHSILAMRTDDRNESTADIPTFVVTLYGIAPTRYNAQIAKVIGTDNYDQFHKSQGALPSKLGAIGQRVVYLMIFRKRRPVAKIQQATITPISKPKK